MALPTGYTQLEYIQSNGSAYIDTGLTVNKSDSWELIFDAHLVSSANWGGANGYLQYQASLGNNEKATFRIVYSNQTEVIYINSVKKSSTSWSSYTGANVKLGIFKLGDVNNAWYSSDGQSGKLYSYKVYKSNVLIRDFIPCKNASNIIGLYDTVNSKFYSSVTSTKFTGPVDLGNLNIGDVLDFSYNGASYELTLPKGIYKLECWGAQGGNYGTYKGGNGGYSVGLLKLDKTTTLYTYTGGQGSSLDTVGGFNGGGTGYGTARGGGGASDIRIGTDSLYARVIVAGGGGGSGTRVSGGGKGAGGGIVGLDGYANNPLQVGAHYSGGGGTQTDAGIGYNSVLATKGAFGQGGNGKGSSAAYFGSGGGSGWYGGGGAYNNDTSYVTTSGGGGSGYVYTSVTMNNYPTNGLLNSSYYLIDAKTINGATSFTSPTGTAETGHSGDGYIRITVMKEIPARTDYDIADVQPDTKFDVGNTINCPYAGAKGTITLPKGIYKLECWGAQGGNYGTYKGGNGGYSVGLLKLDKTTTLYTYTGGQGSSLDTVGGFNGGGTGYGTARGGGGASDIRIGTDSLYARVIVAGGGGGSGTRVSGGGKGAGGGIVGLDGYANNPLQVGAHYSGGGGTQTDAGIGYNSVLATKGAFGQGGNGKGSSAAYFGSGGGSGWYGGGGAYNNDTSYVTTSGGGGSGYVYTKDTNDSVPATGWLLDEKYYLTEASTINGITTFKSPVNVDEIGHTGDGFIRITVIKAIYFNLAIKVNNEWKTTTDAYVNINGEWKSLIKAYGNVGGVWKENMAQTISTSSN